MYAHTTSIVYSSAYYKLCKDFYGQRLFLVLQQYGSSSLMMNFWPYLRQREQEVLERKSAVMSSFLLPAFRGPGDLISAHLWASPDNEKQLTVALRFGFILISYIMSTRPQIPVDAALVWAVHCDLVCERCSDKLAL